MKLSEAISIRIKQLLKDKNLSQYWLCKNGGIPRSTVSDIVNAKKKRVSTATIYQICATLGITLEEFFRDSLFNNLID